MPQHYLQEDFLYHRKGPWPQPSPSRPLQMAPEVLHLPVQEVWDWHKHVGIRYFSSLLSYSPKALLYAWQHPVLDSITDQQFVQLLTTSVYSQYLDPHLDQIDKQHFANYLNQYQTDTLFYKIDLSPMCFMNTSPGFYVAPTITLLRKDKQQFNCIAIKIGDLILTPENSHAWELSKYFVLQGAAYRINLITHPLLHLPFDAINAITKSSVPQGHLLFKLLYPHLRLALAVNHSVIESPFSIIANHPWMPYSPFSGSAEGSLHLLGVGYSGIKGNSSYPAYRYAIHPTFPTSDYGQFLQSYYHVIYEFVSQVILSIPVGDKIVKRWANYCSHWISGFPDGEAIFTENTFAATLSSYIWSVSVAHATDHQAFYSIPTNSVPFRLRLPPPNSHHIDAYDIRDLTHKVDFFKSKMAFQLFYKPYSVQRLIDVDYQFQQPHLIALQQAFIYHLRMTDAQSNPRYIALESIASSIQY